MADLVIRGMKMPRDCPMCKLAHFNRLDEFTGCDAVPGKRYVPHSDEQFWNSAERPKWCPLVPLREGHGRLIDAERFRVILCRLKERQNDDVAIHALNWAIECLDKLDTIVPEEGGGEDVGR